jgi:hypothetical protein
VFQNCSAATSRIVASPAPDKVKGARSVEGHNVFAAPAPRIE